MKKLKSKPEGHATEVTVGSDPWETLISAARVRLPERPENARTFREIRASLGFGTDRARAEVNRLLANGSITRVAGAVTVNGQLKYTQFYVPVKLPAC